MIRVLSLLSVGTRAQHYAQVHMGLVCAQHYTQVHMGLVCAQHYKQVQRHVKATVCRFEPFRGSVLVWRVACVILQFIGVCVYVCDGQIKQLAAQASHSQRGPVEM